MVLLFVVIVGLGIKVKHFISFIKFKHCQGHEGFDRICEVCAQCLLFPILYLRKFITCIKKCSYSCFYYPRSSLLIIILPLYFVHRCDFLSCALLFWWWWCRHFKVNINLHNFSPLQYWVYITAICSTTAVLEDTKPKTPNQE